LGKTHHSQIEKLQEEVKTVRAESAARETEYRTREDQLMALPEHKPSYSDAVGVDARKGK